MAIHLNLNPTTVELLNKLAGGERHKSAYLDRIVPILYEAHEEFTASVEEAQRDVIAATIAKSKAKVAARG